MGPAVKSLNTTDVDNFGLSGPINWLRICSNKFAIGSQSLRNFYNRNSQINPNNPDYHDSRSRGQEQTMSPTFRYLQCRKLKATQVCMPWYKGRQPLTLSFISGSANCNVKILYITGLRTHPVYLFPFLFLPPSLPIRDQLGSSTSFLQRDPVLCHLNCPNLEGHQGQGSTRS